MTVVEEWILWAITLGMVWWSIAFAWVVWKERPPVIYDERSGRYVANRGKRCQRHAAYTPPITPPFGQARAHSGTSRTYIVRRDLLVTRGTSRRRHHSHGQ